MNVIDLAKALIACPSVTPVDAGAQDILAEALEKMGFTVWRLPFGEGEKRVENIFARLGDQSPHICLGGHTDVVPAGDESKWTSPPFEPEIRDNVLYGRGASDMKGSVAAFIAAIDVFLKKNPNPDGSISLLITGDEEADADYGTIKVLEWMEKNNHLPDVTLVGEPTNPDHLGQEIKIGRRGSLHIDVHAKGKQGHVAYPERSENPVPKLAKAIEALTSHVFDEGNEFFPPSSLQMTGLEVDNDGARNVVPGRASAYMNIRFNPIWTSESLKKKIISILDETGIDYDAEFTVNAESFITQPGNWSAIVRDAVADITGKTPEYTTTGGTSDARFFAQFGPVIECGPVNKSIHQIDENARVSDLEDLTKIYTKILHSILG